MKKMLPMLIAAVLTQFQIFAQSINGPSEVCPNTTIRFNVVDCSNGADWQMIGQPQAVTIVASTKDYIDIQFPDYSGGNVFTLQALMRCGAVIATKDISVKSIGTSGSSNIAVPCGHTGSFLFEQSFPKYTLEASVNTTTGWPLLNFSGAPELASHWYRARYNVNNYNSGTVTMTIKSVCTNITPITWTFNISRPAANDLTFPLWATYPGNFCIGGSTTAAVQPYAGAVSYTWESDQPTLKINGQTPPVTTTSPSVTLSETTNGYAGNLSVRANVPCGSSSPISRSFVVNAGAPDLATVMLTNSLGQGGFACYTDAFNIASPVMSPGSTYDYLQVEVIPPAGGTSNFTTTGDFIVPVRRPGWHTMNVTPVNGCGTGNTIVYEFEAIDCTQPLLQKSARTAKEDPADNTAALFSISPNPTKNQVTIRFEKNLRQPLKTSSVTEVRILDLSGHVKITKKAPAENNTLQLDVHALPSGIYVVEVIQGGRARTGKLVISR